MSESTVTPTRVPFAAKAIVFDVFGTLVDWRSSIIDEVAAVGRRHRLQLDAASFADAWRAGYAPAMNEVRSGERPWTRLDALHRMILDDVLDRFGVAGVLSETEIQALNRAWHRLKPWPDVVSGLARLKARFIIAPLSNGNVSLMTRLAKFAGLPWDCVLGAELVRRYKPDAAVYLSAAEFLDLNTAEVMMVAAHLSDLDAAKQAGLITAFVARPHEFGSSERPDLKPNGSVDISATDLSQLADLLTA
jgi:2-haloacid dehalogenase